MANREVKEVLESYRDADGNMRYALQGEIIDAPEPSDAAPKKKAAAQPKPRK